MHLGSSSLKPSLQTKSSPAAGEDQEGRASSTQVSGGHVMPED